MKIKWNLLLAFILIFNLGLSSQNKPLTKIACIGNSITYGANIKNRIKNSYPAQLEQMLGKAYMVRNYGHNGRTMLMKGDLPYMHEEQFFDALDWNPDIVIIKLGSNDAKAKNWKYASEFESDYQTMINAFDTLSSHPKIYLATTVPVFKEGIGIDARVVREEVIPLIKKIAKKNNLELIDLYTPFVDKAKLFPDDVHPNAEGAGEMAKVVYQYITRKRGQLSPQEYPGHLTHWKGFDKYIFNFNGHQAHIVIPKKALAKKPWVWRARFPDWHTEMDSILLTEGYHIVYTNTNNMYGSPHAVAIWNQFYQYLTQKQGSNKKVSLEGASRGGLFMYNWAKQNTDKVNCIYAEAPVCDFKSWPGGFGTGIGSTADWKLLKKEYGFSSDAEAKAYRNNPIDQLDSLAKENIPILHMIGLQDQVVPIDENTIVLVNQYIKLGGAATIIPCTKGKQDLRGHHFMIESPRLGADFIEYHSQTLPPLSSSSYHQLRGGLPNSLKKFQEKEKARVAFVGGSITYNPGWRDSVSQYIEKRFPETEFEFIAAGIPSMGSTCDAFRLERDIFMNGKVDLVFIEAAVNDHLKGRPQNEIQRSMEGMIRHIYTNNPLADVVFMYFVDPMMIKDYQRKIVPEIIQFHDKVAAYYQIPAINLAQEVSERIAAGEFSWDKDFKNLHPSPFGQGLYAHSIIEFLDQAWSEKNEKPSPNVFPKKLDLACYDMGRLIPASEIPLRKGWKYVQDWQPEIKANTRSNYVNVPMLIGDHTSESLKITFKGNAVGLAVAAGPDAGIVKYSIDGGAWKKQDLFTKHSTVYHLPWYFMLADGLENGDHILKIKLSEEKNTKSMGHRCVLRYVFVNTYKKK